MKPETRILRLLRSSDLCVSRRSRIDPMSKIQSDLYLGLCATPSTRNPPSSDRSLSVPHLSKAPSRLLSSPSTKGNDKPDCPSSLRFLFLCLIFPSRVCKSSTGHPSVARASRVCRSAQSSPRPSTISLLSIDLSIRPFSKWVSRSLSSTMQGERQRSRSPSERGADLNNTAPEVKASASGVKGRMPFEHFIWLNRSRAQNDLDNDPVTKIIGRDSRGSVRG
ncbi:hypothetical protein MRB53_023067 [Persea americana]|uniref:Uncharacterized protein n=1 Tax=Persea americana TaxID=3435 RepID=A0ACC2L9M8_PERAE|nr:hypothetical protein MRB53_023067 [Persea americana]